MKTYIHPELKVKLPFASAQAVGGLLFVSGMGPLNMENLEYTPRSIEEETRLTLEILETILKQAGCTRKDVVKCTVWLADLADYEGYNRAFAEFFGSHLPGRSTVGAPLLRDIKVEIEAVAELPKSEA